MHLHHHSGFTPPASLRWILLRSWCRSKTLIRSSHWMLECLTHWLLTGRFHQLRCSSVASSTVKQSMARTIDLPKAYQCSLTIQPIESIWRLRAANSAIPSTAMRNCAKGSAQRGEMTKALERATGIASRNPRVKGFKGRNGEK